MLSQKSKDEIQALYRKLVEKMRLTPRYGQRVMIAEIAKSLGVDFNNKSDDELREIITSKIGKQKTDINSN